MENLLKWPLFLETSLSPHHVPLLSCSLMIPPPLQPIAPSDLVFCFFFTARNRTKQSPPDNWSSVPHKNRIGQKKTFSMALSNCTYMVDIAHDYCKLLLKNHLDLVFGKVAFLLFSRVTGVIIILYETIGNPRT